MAACELCLEWVASRLENVVVYKIARWSLVSDWMLLAFIIITIINTIALQLM